MRRVVDVRTGGAVESVAVAPERNGGYCPSATRAGRATVRDISEVSEMLTSLIPGGDVQLGRADCSLPVLASTDLATSVWTRVAPSHSAVRGVPVR